MEPIGLKEVTPSDILAIEVIDSKEIQFADPYVALCAEIARVLTELAKDKPND